MRKSIHSVIAAFVLAGLAANVGAHPGHAGGFDAGLAHPLIGVDHLIAMIAVGVWAAQLGGRAIWAVPLAFVTAMAAGATLALDAVAPPAIEQGIAASLLVLGLLIASAQRLPAGVAMALTAAFGLFHGAAHGSELPALADPARYAAGFLAATAALHAGGVLLGVASRRQVALVRAAGVLRAAAGATLLVG